jgi:hypothetical protein
LSEFVIRNVGVLKAVDTPSAPTLAQLILLSGRNGRGKTTRDGCSSTVIARNSLGNGGNASWDRKDAPVEVL